MDPRRSLFYHNTLYIENIDVAHGCIIFYSANQVGMKNQNKTIKSFHSTTSKNQKRKKTRRGIFTPEKQLKKLQQKVNTHTQMSIFISVLDGHHKQCTPAYTCILDKMEKLSNFVTGKTKKIESEKGRKYILLYVKKKFELRRIMILA